MSAWLPARPFAVNDLEYRPFGMARLAGVTPRRLAVTFALCAWYAYSRLDPLHVVKNILVHEYLLGLAESGIRVFAGAVPLLLLIVHAERAAAREAESRQALLFVEAVALGALVFALMGFLISWVLVGSPIWHRSFERFGWWMLNLVFQGAAWGGIGAAIVFLEARARRADRLRSEARMETSRIERQIIEARLQLLHAQIEPHFLFNTLASVKRLYETEPAIARDMIRNLRRYLSVAIPSSRVQMTTLGQELSLATAYLDIFKVRMGDRLQVAVDVPGEHRGALVPPLMLGTLVENAVKHGIGPRASGGSLRIESCVVGDGLEVRVSDDGLGFRQGSGRGVGLANTRARLKAAFGAAGRLAVARNHGGGVRATMHLPWRHAARVAEAA